MLKTLVLKRYLLIEEAELNFKKGLNVLTGETGSGKSVLVGSLSVLSGGRVDKDMLRYPDQKAVVEALWQVTDEKVHQWLKERDLFEGNEIIVRREIHPSGRTRAFVNDTPVSIGELKELGSLLVQIQTQHGLLNLKSPAFALELIDSLLEDNRLIERYKTLWKEIQKLKKQREELLKEVNEISQSKQWLEDQKRELDQIPLDEFVDRDIDQEISILENVDTAVYHLGQALNFLADDEVSAETLIYKAINELKTIQNILKDVNQLVETLENSAIAIRDVADELRNKVEDLRNQTENVETLRGIIDQINHLKFKYNVSTVRELIEKREQVKQQLEKVENLEGEIAFIEQELSRLEKELLEVGKLLSNQRKEVATEVEALLNSMLQDLNLSYARIEIEHQESEVPLPSGLDIFSILFSADQGKTFKPVYEVASGGELARLMLAIQAIISRKRSLPTLVLDEVDTGISGETARRVAAFMRKLGERVQIIAITHLPAVAAAAHHHIAIAKEFDDEGLPTATFKELVSDEDRVREVARIMGGEGASEAMLNSAKDLIKEMS
ncbi:MAG: DNA repair protein RecN [Chlorobi bacterium]|nr:DNA repair protein RecN [Chlorobiota bacterium]